jgi:hypothetical protein
LLNAIVGNAVLYSLLLAPIFFATPFLWRSHRLVTRLVAIAILLLALAVAVSVLFVSIQFIMGSLPPDYADLPHANLRAASAFTLGISCCLAVWLTLREPLRRETPIVRGPAQLDVEAMARRPIPKTFICYRHDDSQAITDRMFEHMLAIFPKDKLLRDIDSIPKGSDFRQWIDRSIGGCDILIVIIGPQWLSAVDESGRQRLRDPADFVRLEIEAALRRDIPVIPVTIGGAHLPRPEELPQSLADLPFRHGATVRHDPDFVHDMQRLIADLCASQAVGTPAQSTAGSHH